MKYFYLLIIVLVVCLAPNTLRGGSRELKAYADEAQRFGVIFDETQGKDVERFVDALGRLRDLLKGLGQRIVLELGPGVADTIEGLTFLIGRGREKAAAGQGGLVSSRYGRYKSGESAVADYLFSGLFKGIENRARSIYNNRCYRRCLAFLKHLINIPTLCPNTGNEKR